jgi:hypothetical protein
MIDGHYRVHHMIESAAIYSGAIYFHALLQAEIKPAPAGCQWGVSPMPGRLTGFEIGSSLFWNAVEN